MAESVTTAGGARGDADAAGAPLKRPQARVDQRYARKHRNRRLLIAAAMDLFRAKGFDATTIDQIAEAAGVAPRTFFYHFAAKEDIVFDGYADRLDNAIRRFRDSPATSLGGALGDAAIAVAEAIDDNRDEFLLRQRLYTSTPSLRARVLAINEAWIDTMTDSVADRLGLDPRADLRPRLAASLINTANRVAIEIWGARGGAGNLTEMIRESTTAVLPALDQIGRTVNWNDPPDPVPMPSDPAAAPRTASRGRRQP